MVATAKPFNKNFQGEKDMHAYQVQVGNNITLDGNLNLPENPRGVVLCATHLFEEPGALEQVAQLASQWFTRYLAS